MDINSPTLYLKMDVIIDVTSFDSSGNLQNFSVVNATIAPDDTFGSCTVFNNDAFLFLPSSTLGALGNGSAAFGITAWVLPVSLSGEANSFGMSNVFFSSGDMNAGTNNVVLGISQQGQLQVMLSSNNGTLLTFGTTALASDGWHFVAISMGDTNFLVQIDSITYTATLSAGTLTATGGENINIASSSDLDSYFTGSMANLRVYPVAMEAADFTAVIDADLSGELMVYLPLNESTSDSTPDDSPYNFPATTQGSPVIIPDPQFGTVMQLNGTSQYISLGGPEYLTTMSLTEVTVQAWIKTQVTTPMTIASYDVKNYWELALVPGTTAGSLIVSWTTVDENGTPDTLNGTVAVNDGQWHFISASFHAGDGQKFIYVDAEIDTTDTTDGLPLGSAYGTAVYGSVGIGQTDGVMNTSGYYSGFMCQFWLYHRAITQEKIKLNMEAGLIAAASYSVGFPIGFSLEQEGQQNTLFIYDVVEGQTLNAQLTNTSVQAINFPASSEDPTPGNYQLAIVFRPGTLAQETITGITLSQSASWNMVVIQNGGVVALLFNSISGYTFYPMSQLTLTLNNTGANPFGGARTTLVLLGYDGLTYSDSGGAVDGKIEIVTGIVNHAGEQTSPLHVGFVSGNVVFCDNKTTNTLAIRITNTVGPVDGVQQLVFNSTGLSPTRFLLYFDGEESATDPCALNLYSAIAAIGVTLDGWKVNLEPEDTIPYWTITPQSDFTLMPGQSLQINLSNIIAATPAGICNAYLVYENLPGYWDGEFILEIQKDNVYSNGINLGIGTNTPSHPLSINNSGTGLDSSGGTGLDFYVDGISLPVVQLDGSGNLFVGSSTNPGNVTLNNGNLVLNYGDLQVENGFITLTEDLVLYSDGSNGLRFRTLPNTPIASVMVDTNNNLNVLMGAASNVMQINPSGNIGMGASALPGVGLIINTTSAVSPTAASGTLLVGAPTANYLALDYGTIAAKYTADNFGTLTLQGSGIVVTGQNSVILNAPSISIEPNGSPPMMTIASGGITIPTGTPIFNMPVVTWQEFMVACPYAGGQTFQQTTGIGFDSNVISAISMIKSWSLRYTGTDDHNLLIASITSSCGSISGSSVQLTITAELTDDDYDKQYYLYVDVVILAWVSAVPYNIPPTR